ncbi:MAG: Hsp33 family molecular chaperone HslO [Pseudobdellovibrionaceae bacterium]
MSDTKDQDIVDFPMPEDNIVQTFQLEISSLRGRVLKLGSILDDILIPHNYPAPIDRLTGEVAVLALLLSSILKYEGIFTLQVQGDGPLSMLVADVDSDLNVRACAHYKADEFAKLKSPEKATLTELFGKGYIAFTVDQGSHMERYQGIVGLDGETLEDSIAHYFQQSEQLQTQLHMTVAKKRGTWRAGGIMLQRMPLDAKVVQEEIRERVDEDWSRAKMLLDTVKPEELLDPKLHENTLLMRLFHEEGVRVYSPKPVTKGCRCSIEKLEGVLQTLPQDDIEHITVDGKIEVICEFCSKTFSLDPPQK